MRTYPAAPHPFVLVLPAQGMEAHDDGSVALGINLFGRANALLAHVVFALQQAGQGGVGPERPSYRLLRAEQYDTHGWMPILAQGGVLEPRPVAVRDPPACPQDIRIAFTVSHIETFTDAAGQPLADIDSASANTAVADAITAAVRALTADPTCALHASIAGGRKTMGFYLGYALSLFGRPQDRLSHVLVSLPFESEPQFFYPPAQPRVLDIKDRPVHTSDARVMLAEIPFVRLRDGLDPRLVNGAASYSDVVAAAQAAVAPPELVLDLHTCRIRAAGHEFRLAPARLALLALFARRAQVGDAPLAAPIKDVPDVQWGARYLEQYLSVSGTAALGAAGHRTALDHARDARG